MIKALGTLLVKYQNSSSKIAQEALKKYYKRNDPLPGFCNTQQSQKFSKMQSNIHESNWRTSKYLSQKLKLSSIGIGTQGGQPNEETDIRMFQVIYQSIKSGSINVIDTDVNFRFGKSQKTINAALNYLKEEGISRSSIFIATKCGYMLNDIDSNLDEKKFGEILLNDGYITKDQIVNEIHCIHPNFIEFSVEKSLLSLGVQTIDLLYLNNPTESQQTVIGKQLFFIRLQKALQSLQMLRTKNKIRYYGVASFISLRSPPNEDGIHIQLSQIMNLARKVGGESHGLRFILVPFNLGMPQVLMRWQKSTKDTQQHIFKIAQQYNVNINICCPLFQGRVTNLPFKSQILNNIKNNSAKHLQLVRSIPKQPVLTTIFSTLNIQHLKQNIQVTKNPYLTQQEWKKVLPV